MRSSGHTPIMLSMTIRTNPEALVELSALVTDARLKAAGVTMNLQSLGLSERKVKVKLPKRVVDKMAGLK